LQIVFSDNIMSPSGSNSYGLLEIFTEAKPEGQWWSYRDLIGRAIIRPIMLHYYNMVTHPISYFVYTWMHMKLWYHPVVAVIVLLLYPFVPISVFAARLTNQAYQKFLKYINPSATSWDSGSVWFVEPDSWLKKAMWSFAKDFSAYSAGFWLIGNSQEGMDQTWYDHVTHKDYWRSLFERTGARYPRAIGRFENNKMNFYKKVDCDVVCKIVDGYLGIGDLFLTKGKDFNGNEDLERLMIRNETYKGKSVILLEWVRPEPNIGVHQIDVVTIKTRKHGVVPLSILLWADCTGPSSHSSQCGYVIDYETETVVSATEWYTYFFLGKPAKRIGQKIEGIKKGVEMCIKMHEEIKEPWLRAVGWDFMVCNQSAVATDGGVPTKNVFFEGNFAHQRFPRRVFLSWKSLYGHMSHWGDEMSTSFALEGRRGTKDR